MKIHIVILAAMLIACNSRSVNDDKGGINFQYPKAIDSLGLSGLFDTTKFILYSYHSDIEFNPKSPSLDKKIFFSYLPLEYERLQIRSDTVEIYFNYYFDNKPVKSFDLKKYVYLKSGVGYNIKSHKVLYLTTERNFVEVEEGTNSRLVNPLQPEVITFIKNNKDKLNSWFREEAIRRKVIE